MMGRETENSGFALCRMIADSYPKPSHCVKRKSEKEYNMLEILKAILFGIVEGITEWLPVSSTGHLILLDEFIRLDVSESFYEMFEVVIQLGAILAVILLFFHKLNPFSLKKDQLQKKNTWSLWFKVIVAVVPSALIGLVLDDWMDAHFYNYVVVSVALIVYGVAFLFVERGNKHTRIDDVYAIDYRTALLIGCFQCLSLIPGTSRSGSTILGAILLGVARPAGAEFSFFLAIPTMLGASALKLLKYLLEGLTPTGTEIAVLITGCIVSFLVSLLVIRVLMDFVRKRSFAPFGVYRIVLGAGVIIWMVCR
jgi:undecaprenyl-diphosphatase